MRIVYIFMVGRLTRYCIYLCYLELMAKSLRPKYAPSHTSPDSRLEAFHDKRDTYNCSIDYYIAYTSHTFIIGHMCSSETVGRLQAIIYMMLA
jgi:hypothetical protein